MEDTVKGGACNVTVLVVPGATRIEVVYAGNVIVVAEAKPLG